ncbi:MAG: class I SAM-dependent methyltransferase [Spirochaetota bacterium]
MNGTLGFYDSHAREATASYERVDFSPLVDRFAATLGPAGRVLDLGCGSGRDAARLLSGGYDVVAADGSEAMLAEATALHPELAGRTARVVLPGPLPSTATPSTVSPRGRSSCTCRRPGSPRSSARSHGS